MSLSPDDAQDCSLHAAPEGGTLPVARATGQDFRKEEFRDVVGGARAGRRPTFYEKLTFLERIQYYPWKPSKEFAPPAFHILMLPIKEVLLSLHL